MDNPDHPRSPSQGNGPERNAHNTRSLGRSRLEKLLVKSPNWKKRTLRAIDANAEPSENKTDDHLSKTARLAFLLSAQLAERNEEIERLRKAVSTLKDEKSQLHRAHRRQIEHHRSELVSLQDAYSQFEKESDRLLSQLDQQNERLVDECRQSNVRSLLKD